MKIDRIVTGQLQSNCYVAYDEKSLDAMVIDPGDEPDRILQLINEKRLRVVYIVCTHGHFDHIGAVAELKEETHGKIALHRDELTLYRKADDQAALWGFDVGSQPSPDIFVAEGDELEVGNIKFTVLASPGHSPGGICLYGDGIVFTGDTVFAGSVGRTDLFGGSIDDLKKSFRRIMSLPPDTVIFPGHGDPSTVGQEKESNFFMYEL